jgi:hypothetical protein
VSREDLATGRRGDRRLPHCISRARTTCTWPVTRESCGVTRVGMRRRASRARREEKREPQLRHSGSRGWRLESSLKASQMLCVARVYASRSPRALQRSRRGGFRSGIQRARCRRTVRVHWLGSRTRGMRRATPRTEMGMRPAHRCTRGGQETKQTPCPAGMAAISGGPQATDAGVRHERHGPRRPASSRPSAGRPSRLLGPPGSRRGKAPET